MGEYVVWSYICRRSSGEIKTSAPLLEVGISTLIKQTNYLDKAMERSPLVSYWSRDIENMKQVVMQYTKQRNCKKPCWIATELTLGILTSNCYNLHPGLWDELLVNRKHISRPPRHALWDVFLGSKYNALWDYKVAPCSRVQASSDNFYILDFSLCFYDCFETFRWRNDALGQHSLQ